MLEPRLVEFSAVYGVDRGVWQSSGDAKAPSLLEQRLAGKLQAVFPLSARVAALVEAEAAATSSGPRPFDSLAPAEVASWLAAHGAVQHWATVATHSSLSGARMRELSARRGALGDAGPADGVELPPRTEMFAFPTGARLAAGDGPAPAPPIETHTFVITDFAGRRLYFHCAVRHHRVSTRKLSLVRLQIGAKLMSSGLLDARDASSGDGARRRGLGGPSAAPRESAPETDLPQTIYEPQILCVLSLLPYHASLRRALVAFARTVPEDEELTLEHAASLHAMLAKRAPASPAPPTAIELPPSARGAADAEPDARDGARPAASPRLTVPSLATRAWEREHGPQTDEPRARAPEGSSADARRQFHYRGIEQSLRPLLRRLEPKHVVLLYTAVLCERSVLVLSASASDLVASLEAIRALLHPLEWPHIYIPLTPPHRELLEIFEAPVPYLAGLLRGPAGCGAMAAPPPPDNAPTSPPGPRTPAKSHAVAPQPDSEERGARRARARTGSIEARSRLNLVDVDAALALKLAPDAIVVDLDANQVLDARRLAKAGGPADDDGDESLLLDLSLLPPRLALRLHHAIEMHAPIFRVHHPNDVLQGAQLPSTADGPTREFARELSKGTGSHEWAGEEDGEDPTPAAHERSADRGGPLPGRADANANDARDMQMWSPCSWKLLDWTSERMARENVVSPSTTPGASEPASGGSTRRSRGGAPPTSIATPTGGSATPSGRTDVFWKQLPSRRQSWKPSVTLKLLHILHSSEEDEDESCQLSPTADAARDGRSLKFSARDGDSDNDIADIAETGAGGRAATAARGAASPCQEDGVRSLSPTALGVARSPLSEPPAGASDDAGRAAAERFAEAAAPLEPSEGADGRQGLLDARPGGGDVEDDADGPLARQENRCTNEPALRAAFLGVLVSLLQGYRQHLVLDVPDAPPAASGPAAGADQRIFDAGAFVAQVARRRSECAPFVRGLCETQMFHMFLHARVLSGASAAPAERAPDAPATGGAPSVALDLFDRRIRQRLKQKALRIALHSSATDIDLELGEMWKAKRGTQSRHWRRRRFALLHTPTLDDDDRPAGGPPRSPERDAADDSSAALGMSLCLGYYALSSQVDALESEREDLKTRARALRTPRQHVQPGGGADDCSSVRSISDVGSAAAESEDEAALDQRLRELRCELRAARERALKGRFPLVRGVTQITLPESSHAEFQTPFVVRLDTAGEHMSLCADSAAQRDGLVRVVKSRLHTHSEVRELREEYLSPDALRSLQHVHASLALRARQQHIGEYHALLERIVAAIDLAQAAEDALEGEGWFRSESHSRMSSVLSAGPPERRPTLDLLLRPSLLQYPDASGSAALPPDDEPAGCCVS